MRTASIHGQRPKSEAETETLLPQLVTLFDQLHYLGRVIEDGEFLRIDLRLPEQTIAERAALIALRQRLVHEHQSLWREYPLISATPAATQ
jgi:hypothetical protein